MGTVVILTTLAYGTVHQPTLAMFYIAVTLLVLLWAIDSMLVRSVRYSNSALQIPLLAAAIYGIVQVIPLGSSTVNFASRRHSTTVPSTSMPLVARLIAAPVRGCAWPAFPS